MSDAKASAATDPPVPYGSPAYSWYVVILLTLIYTCNGVDRSLPNILIEPIKHEFNLSDGQLGLFSGLAYGLSFSAAILPLGYIGDRVNRRNFLAGLLIVWSLFTAMGGFARTYATLLLARVGVGAFESGAAPLVVPMMSDIFPPRRRSFVLGIFYMSSPVAVLVANVLGGYVAAEHGWRAAFFIAGVPGIILAVLLVTTVREPRRNAMGESTAGVGDKPATMVEVFRYVVRQPSLLALMCACALLSVLNTTFSAWISSFFIRVHGMGLKETGIILGVGVGVCSTAGPPLMGWLADRLSVRDSRWPLRLITWATMIAFALTLWMLFTPSAVLAVVLFIMADICRASYPPPTYATLMTNTPPQMRGSMMSLLMLLSVLAGFGLGPPLTGVLSDHFGGGAGIRYALAALSILFPLAAILLALASRGLHRSAAQAAVMD